MGRFILIQQIVFCTESASDRCFVCESEASATDDFCAKAKRQQQMFCVRKRSVSAGGTFTLRRNRLERRGGLNA